MPLSLKLLLPLPNLLYLRLIPLNADVDEDSYVDQDPAVFRMAFQSWTRFVANILNFMKLDLFLQLVCAFARWSVFAAFLHPSSSCAI